jgi:hypothetical protein
VGIVAALVECDDAVADRVYSGELRPMAIG